MLLDKHQSWRVRLRCGTVKATKGWYCQGDACARPPEFQACWAVKIDEVKLQSA